MITREDVEQLLAVGNESRSFEVKGPGSLRDKEFVARVARAAMAMGNLRDGGVVCVGIDELRMKAMEPGLSPTQASEWSDYDNVTAAIARYADPAVTFDLASYELRSGARVAILDVEEFDLVPHVCKKTLPNVLQDGMTYVRPRGTPQSVMVPNSAEMRALLDLATAKSVREWIRVGVLAGVPLTLAKSKEELDAEAYEEERRLAWADPSPAVTDLLKHGYFDVSVRPTDYASARLLPVDLESFVVDNTVRLRGWPVPFVDNRTKALRKMMIVGQDIEASGSPHHEAWRMCGSGQFLQLRVLATDLLDTSAQLPTDSDAVGAVAVWDVLLYLVELAEFGARMATALEVRSVTFEVSLCGIDGRELVSGDWRREFDRRYFSPSNVVSTVHAADSARLLADAPRVGIDVAQHLFGHFGLKIADQVLLDWQAQVFNGH